MKSDDEDDLDLIMKDDDEPGSPDWDRDDSPPASKSGSPTSPPSPPRITSNIGTIHPGNTNLFPGSMTSPLHPPALPLDFSIPRGQIRGFSPAMTNFSTSHRVSMSQLTVTGSIMPGSYAPLTLSTQPTPLSHPAMKLV